MSATMEGNRETFASYFQKFSLNFIDIPSRLHTVHRYYLGDILALTNYKPKSMFGTGFGGNTFNATDVSSYQSSYQSPFLQQELHRSTTVPANLPNYHNGNMVHHGGYYDSTFFLQQPQPSGFAGSGMYGGGHPSYNQGQDFNQSGWG